MFDTQKKIIQQTLTDKLLECQTMQVDSQREMVVKRLREEISSRIESKGSPRASVLSIVEICWDYDDGITELLREVRFFERNSIPMIAVEEYCRQSLFRPSTSQTGRNTRYTPVVVEKDELLTTGREVHWDREPIVKQFVRMVKREGPKSILLIQGSKEAGLDTLINRFTKICDKMVKENHNQIPIVFKETQLGGNKKPIPFVQRILKDLKKCCEDSEDELLRTKAAVIFKDIGNVAGIENATSDRLVEELNKYLCQMAQACTIVIVLSHFENLLDSDLPDDFFSQWLNTCPPKEKGLVIVITSEKGLVDRYPPSCEVDSILAADTLDLDLFLRWAREGYELDEKMFTDEQLEQIHQMLNGKVVALGDFLFYHDMARQVHIKRAFEKEV